MERHRHRCHRCFLPLGLVFLQALNTELTLLAVLWRTHCPSKCVTSLQKNPNYKSFVTRVPLFFFQLQQGQILSPFSDLSVFLTHSIENMSRSTNITNFSFSLVLEEETLPAFFWRLCCRFHLCFAPVLSQIVPTLVVVISTGILFSLFSFCSILLCNAIHRHWCLHHL